MTNILAIDPGAQGGIAWTQGGGAVVAWALPANEDEITYGLRALLTNPPGLQWECFMEQVGGYIGEDQPGSRMFNFGDSYGFLRGTVKAIGIMPRLVRPQIWQRGIPNRVGTKTERKNALKAHAKKCFPDLKVTLATADALCILNYAMRYGISDTLGPKHQKAEAWCIANGWEIPEYGSNDYKRMFAYWCKEVLQKKG